MKKNLLLLINLVAVSGSVSAMQKPWDMERDIMESYMRCIDREKEDRAQKNQACDELKAKQGASYPEIARCKANADDLVKQQWEKSSCPTLGRLLESFTEIRAEMREKGRLTKP